MNIEKWDTRFLQMADLVRSWSKDPSTKCGAVIVRGKHVVSIGFNGFAAGCDDHNSIYENRELKYERVLHAETNAILTAKQDLTGCTLYVMPMLPCARCTAMLIQAGIKRIVSISADPSQKERWGDSFMIANDMLSEAGIEVSMYQKNDIQ